MKTIPCNNLRRKAASDKDRPIRGLQYFDLKRNWTRRVKPHMGDRKLNAVLVRDFNRLTYGRWRKRFEPGNVPRDFESCDWWIGHPGPEPHFWRYVKHSACHWLVNFNLRLAQLVEPSRPWRILSIPKHSTVWDGDKTLFDFNFLALGLAPRLLCPRQQEATPRRQGVEGASGAPLDKGSSSIPI